MAFEGKPEERISTSTPESNEGNENAIGKQAVIDALQEHGFEHDETRELVIKWTEQQEATLGETKKGRIEFEINRADIYVAAGDKEGALECLDHAAMQAKGEDDDELLNQIVKKREEIEQI